MCDETRFVDNHIITLDIDPETEANIRADERTHVLDMVRDVCNDDSPGLGTYVDAVTRRLRPDE